MKSRQLANVLIKILGLCVCLYAIPSGLGGLFLVFLHAPKSEMDFTVLADGLATAVQAVVGIVIIAGSRQIAAFWFKEEND